MKENSLLKKLSTIKDPRRGEGQRHELVFVLVLIIMATMSGFYGYRSIGDFITKNKKDLIRYFKPKKNRLPSFSTVRRIMIGISFDDFILSFHEWSKDYISIKKGDWLNLDGKAIKGTFDKNNPSRQHFINLVSIFADRTGTVLNAGKILNSKESEIPKVKELIQKLDIEGVVFTIDALHCQKKTIVEIIDSKNDYVIGVKGNQPNLLKQIKETTSDAKNIISISKISERSRGRSETREVYVSDNISGISKEWKGLKSIIKVERTVVEKNKTSNETAFYISSLDTDAHGFNVGIRRHWGIENRLHYVKDVTFKEDGSKIKAGNSAENFSIIRNIVINIFRNDGWKNIKQATRLLSNEIRKLKKLIE